MITIEELLKKVDIRIESEATTGDMVLSVIDRSQYPRLWIDNDLETNVIKLIESDEALIQRLNPFIEKDWIVRFYDRSLQGLLKQYIEWQSNSS